MTNGSACPDLEELQQLAAGRLSPSAADTLVGRVETCPSCLARIQSLSLHDTLVQSLAQVREEPAGPDAEVIERLASTLKALPAVAAEPQKNLSACHNGGKRLQLRQDAAGRQVKCPACGRAARVAGPPSPHAPGQPAPEPRRGPAPVDFSSQGDPGSDTARCEPSASEEEVWQFLAPPQAPDEIGRLGPYRILAVLGRGGMSVVFRAEDLG
jgi:hypothetical protein